MAIIVYEEVIDSEVNSRIIGSDKFEAVDSLHPDTHHLLISEKVDFNRPQSQFSNPKKGIYLGKSLAFLCDTL